jgi:hypothetical protein
MIWSLILYILQRLWTMWLKSTAQRLDDRIYSQICVFFPFIIPDAYFPFHPLQPMIWCCVSRKLNQHLSLAVAFFVFVPSFCWSIRSTRLNTKHHLRRYSKLTWIMWIATIVSRNMNSIPSFQALLKIKKLHAQATRNSLQQNWHLKFIDYECIYLLYPGMGVWLYI